MMPVERMIFQADEQLLERVRSRAKERGVSVARIVREALERELGEGAKRPRPRSIGTGASGIPGGIARRVDEIYEPDPWRS